MSATPSRENPDGLKAPERFSVVRKLGSGGMGTVYEALDLERGIRLAVKTLRTVDSTHLLHLKEEFRSLCEISHPNLASFYELISSGGEWFLTMEFVDGTDFLTYVRGDPGQPDKPATPNVGSEDRLTMTMNLPLPASPAASADSRRSGEPLSRADQVERLRSALAQLAAGVSALHRGGKLHRDIKPSNIMVTREGRTVLLDFGLATNLRLDFMTRAVDGISGTYAYMSPEQSAGKPLNEASDWYSVGCVLREALTGVLPPGRGKADPLVREARGEPADLFELCEDLLQAEPGARPSGAEVLRRLGAQSFLGPSHAAERASVFVGREKHTAALHDAFNTVKTGNTVAIYVHGPSGIGKSELIRHFLETLALLPEVVILAGRCYEQESVPYKALDSLIDSLVSYLGRLPRDEATLYLPRRAAALARVFPALRRLSLVADAPDRRLDSTDEQEVRRHAFGALREMLARIADRKQLILYVDDLQWGDSDSASLLSEILRPPDAPALLLLGVYRSEYAGRSPCLKVLVDPSQEPGYDRRQLAVEPLSRTEARELSVSLLGQDNAVTRIQADVIALESGGNPYFVVELAHNLHNAGPAVQPAAEVVTLDTFLWNRISRLPDASRSLLEVMAVAGRPLPQADCYRAAGIADPDPAVLTVLRTGRLVRGTGPAKADELELYHDRVRETVLHQLKPSELRTHHRSLARILESAASPDPEVLALHLHGAGELPKAGHYYALAADRAAEALAFGHAADLYQTSIEFSSLQGAELRAQQVRLGDALANAGRAVEAARIYRTATEGAGTAEILSLRRREAYQYCISGHVEEGRAAFIEVLARVGMKLPKTTLRAGLLLMMTRAWLAFRGLRFRERAEAELSERERNQIDAAWAAGSALALVDLASGAYFTARALLLALRAGEPYRIARSLAWEGATHSSQDQTGKRRALRYYSLCGQIVDRIGHPHARGLLAQARACTALTMGEIDQAKGLFDEAEQILAGECTGVTWELATVRMFALHNLYLLGELAEVSTRSAMVYQDAQVRGDLYTAANLGCLVEPVMRLAADRPDAAVQMIDDSLARWPQQGFYMQHYFAAEARSWVDLYRGDGVAAWNQICEKWPLLKQNYILSFEMLRILCVRLRSQCALAAAAQSKEPASLIRSADKDIQSLEREVIPVAKAFAVLSRAGVASLRGDRPLAQSLLEDAFDRLSKQHMNLVAQAVKRRLGVMIGGEPGRLLVGEADVWMAQQRIVRPGRIMRMYTCGFPATEQ